MRKTFFSYLAVLFMFLFPSAIAFAATDDYTNYWKFDEGYGRSANDAKGGQNGVMTGSSTGFGWASGKIGNALGMDGLAGEAIVLPNSILQGSQGTISAWFKMIELTDHSIIFSAKSTTDSSIYAAVMIDREGRPQLQSRVVASGADNKVNGGKILNKNEWYHLVLTANGQGYHMYLNGEEMTLYGFNNGRWIPDLTNHTLMYRIGALDSSPLNGSFNGYIDDVRLYDRPISFEEVTALYNEGNIGVPTIPGVVTPPPATVPVTEVTISNPPPAPPTPPAQTVTTPSPTSPAPAMDPAVKKKLIDELVKQIMALIIELQKQLAALKAAQTTGAAY